MADQSRSAISAPYTQAEIDWLEKNWGGELNFLVSVGLIGVNIIPTGKLELGRALAREFMQDEQLDRLNHTGNGGEGSSSTNNNMAARDRDHQRPNHAPTSTRRDHDTGTSTRSRFQSRFGRRSIDPDRATPVSTTQTMRDRLVGRIPGAPPRPPPRFPASTPIERPPPGLQDSAPIQPPIQDFRSGRARRPDPHLAPAPSPFRPPMPPVLPVLVRALDLDWPPTFDDFQNDSPGSYAINGPSYDYPHPQASRRATQAQTSGHYMGYSDSYNDSYGSAGNNTALDGDIGRQSYNSPYYPPPPVSYSSAQHGTSDTHSRWDASARRYDSYPYDHQLPCAPSGPTWTCTWQHCPRYGIRQIRQCDMASTDEAFPPVTQRRMRQASPLRFHTPSGLIPPVTQRRMRQASPLRSTSGLILPVTQRRTRQASPVQVRFHTTSEAREDSGQSTSRTDTAHHGDQVEESSSQTQQARTLTPPPKHRSESTGLGSPPDSQKPTTQSPVDQSHVTTPNRTFGPCGGKDDDSLICDDGESNSPEDGVSSDDEDDLEDGFSSSSDNEDDREDEVSDEEDDCEDDVIDEDGDDREDVASSDWEDEDKHEARDDWPQAGREYSFDIITPPPTGESHAIWYYADGEPSPSADESGGSESQDDEKDIGEGEDDRTDVGDPDTNPPNSVDESYASNSQDDESWDFAGDREEINW